MGFDASGRENCTSRTTTTESDVKVIAAGLVYRLTKNSRSVSGTPEVGRLLDSLSGMRIGTAV